MNNNGLFHTRSFKILLTVCAAMLCLMLFTAGFGGEAPSNLLSFFSTPMQRVGTLVTNNAAVAARDASVSKDELIERKRPAAPADRGARKPARRLLRPQKGKRPALRIPRHEGAQSRF